jgi:nucleotide-binding universal stress UspA family protein
MDLACAAELRRLEAMAQAIDAPSVHMDAWVRTGDVQEEIARHARHLDVDAVVLGSRQPQGVGEKLFGTLSDRVTNELRRPIMTVPSTSQSMDEVREMMPN